MMQDIPRQELSLVILLKITQENAESSIMHSKKNLVFSIVDFEHNFNVWILHYARSLVLLSKKILEFSTHDLETLLFLGSYKIMQDLMCILPRKILDFQCMILILCIVWILQDKARSLVHLSKKNLVFTSMILKLYCCMDLTQ